MRIAFLGTRGIPNNYGGFEQFAEYLSVGLAKLGHEVTVYNPHFHPYKQDDYKGVKIEHIYSPENLIGASANYIYDYLCLRHALERNYDIIYEAGYASAAFFYLLLPIGRSKIITNMDGLEWKRAKWNFFVKVLTRLAEKIVVAKSHYLIADNVGIQKYYEEKFNKKSFYLSYGATLPSRFEIEALKQYDLKPYDYSLIIARMEPENNIEPMIEAYLRSNACGPLILIGDYTKKYGRKISMKYKNERIRFVGGLYDRDMLDSLRFFAKAYLHGHSVGGTNPSLLEAMASSSFIIAHNNSFNYSVLGIDALYFNDSDDLAITLNSIDSYDKLRSTYAENNKKKINENYDWQKVILQHEKLFSSL